MYDPFGPFGPQRDPHRDFLDWQREGGAYQQWKKEKDREPEEDKGCLNTVGNIIGFLILVFLCLVVIQFISS
jgi:hypothetical protein